MLIGRLFLAQRLSSFTPFALHFPTRDWQQQHLTGPYHFQSWHYVRPSEQACHSQKWNARSLVAIRQFFWRRWLLHECFDPLSHHQPPNRIKSGRRSRHGCGAVGIAIQMQMIDSSKRRDLISKGNAVQSKLRPNKKDHRYSVYTAMFLIQKINRCHYYYNWFNWIHEFIRLSFDFIIEQNFKKPFVMIDAFVKEKIVSIIEIRNLEK